MVAEELRLEITTQVSGAIRDLQRVKTEATAIEDLGKRLSKTGKLMTLFVTAPLIAAAGAAVKAASDMEMQQAAFETMLGSAEKAKVLLGELQEFAAKTPFQLTDLTESTKMMLAYGISLEDVMPNLKQLGDIALGDKNKLMQLTRAFGQIQSAGKLMGQDLLQLINVGFNPLQMMAADLAKELGIPVNDAMALVRQRMSEGAISAAEVAQKFVEATSEGGLFFEGMERASETLTGKFSTLKDEVVMMAIAFGELMLPTIKEVVKIVSGFVERLNKMDEGTKRAIITVGTVVAALGPLLFIGGKILTAIPLLVAGIKAVGVALMFLNANPIALIILGVAALATGIYLLIKNWDEVSAFLISAGKKVLEWFKENWDKILIILTGPLGLAVVLIIKHWDEIKAAFQAAYDFIVKIVTRIKEELTQRLAAVVEPVKKVAEGIKGAFSWLKDQLVGNSVIPDMVDSILEHMDRLRKGLDVSYEVERLARTAADALEPFTDAIGLMATDAAAGWEAFKNAARDAIASVLRMLAEKAFAQAISQIPGLPFTAGAMAAWTAAGIAALAAAGVVKGLASGGIVTQPTLAMVGERGPEAVIPLGRGGGMGTVNVYVQGSLMEEEGLVRRITEVQKRYARGY